MSYGPQGVLGVLHTVQPHGTLWDNKKRNVQFASSLWLEEDCGLFYFFFFTGVFADS